MVGKDLFQVWVDDVTKEMPHTRGREESGGAPLLQKDFGLVP